MRFASYVAGGVETFGLVVADGLVDLGRRRPDVANLRTAIADGALADLAGGARGEQPDHAISAVEFLPVVPEPRKILCAGINYGSHAGETGRDVTAHPSVFARFNDSLVGHGQPLVHPGISEEYDFEGELAVVIGRGGRHIAERDALSHVAGYTCFNDGSVRSHQHVSVTAGKNFDRAGAVGPWLVTADEVAEPGSLTLVTRVNDVEMQRTSTGSMIFSVQEIVSWCSSFTELSPGDVIATGTPDGVGSRRTPPQWLVPGDRVEVEISDVGTLRNTVVASDG